jgi:LacI family transcriptional regulator
LSIITTDLFPKLVEELRAGNVAATIYQRPRTQGRLAFQVLYNHLVDGRTPQRAQVTLVPHLVMRGNLDYFLARHPMGVRANAASAAAEANEESSELATFD